MSELPEHISWLCARTDDTSILIDRIHTAWRRLAEITSPFQDPLQEHVYEEYIKKIQELIQQANTDILDIEANHRKDIFFTDLKKI